MNSTSPPPRAIRAIPLALLLAACADQPTATPRDPEPRAAPRVVGVYEFTLTGIGTPAMRASVAQVAGPSQTLTPVATGVTFESVSSGNVMHGSRGQGGQRYVTMTYRVRNMTGTSLANLTMIPVTRSNTIAGTPFSSLVLFNGTAANTAIASQVVPSGDVTLTDEGGLQAVRTDVLQVFEEAEIAAITPPAGVTGLFPYGFVIRNPATPGSRTLPSTADPNEFAGSLTFSFRYPLQTTASADPFTMSFQAIAVEDTETRLTESIEEGQDSAAVRRIRERASELGATTVTVLAGSSAMDPDVTDYPGQRQICSVRTAGAAGSPTTTITAPAGYARIAVFRPGESLSACGAYFTSGTAQTAAFNTPFQVTVRALDLYGNVKTSVDTVRLLALSGPPATLPAPTALISGTATVTLTYDDYGTSLLRAVGRRNRGTQTVAVAGVTRTWTGSVSTSWSTAGNWSTGVVPGALDTAVIPLAAAQDPVLIANTSIGGVTVEDGATVDVGAFDLTASSSVSTGASTGIINTTGRLILTGTAKTVEGNLPRVRVTGTYTLSGAVATRARVEVAGGRLRTTGLRLRTTAY